MTDRGIKRVKETIRVGKNAPKPDKPRKKAQPKSAKSTEGKD